MNEKADDRQILFFHLPQCPRCLRARQLMAELFVRHPEYKDLPIREVNELNETASANAHNYNFVPSFFVGGKKIFEGRPSYKKIKKVFEAAAD